VQRKIAARWQEWVPWVLIDLLRRERDAASRSAEFDRIRRRHSEHLLNLMRLGIGMRLTRRHRLDDPRITDELRSVLMRSVMERRRKVWSVRHYALCNPQSITNQPRDRITAEPPQSLESSRTSQQVPQDMLGPQEKSVPIDLIQKRVSEHFHLPGLGDQALKVRSSRLVIVFPRQVAMYIVKQLTTASLLEIGRQFGGKHHTTVLHSINKIKEMRRSDQKLNCTIARLMNMLKQPNTVSGRNFTAKD